MSPNRSPNRLTSWLEDAWLARYLDRQLSADEVAWFESYVLDKPDLLAGIDADNRLRDALAADARPAVSASPTVEYHPQAAGRAIRRGRYTWLAAAAVLVTGIGIGTFLHRSHPAWSDSGPVANPPRYFFDASRGDSDQSAEKRVVTENGDSKSTILIVDIAVSPGTKVNEAVVESDGRRVVLPKPVISSEYIVTYVLPTKVRGGRLTLAVETAGNLTTRVFQIPREGQ